VTSGKCNYLYAECCSVISYQGHMSPKCYDLNWNSDWEQSGPFRPKAGLCRHCGSHLSVASLIASEQWCGFCTPSLAIFLTCCYQLDSNLANLEATV